MSYLFDHVIEVQQPSVTVFTSHSRLRKVYSCISVCVRVCVLVTLPEFLGEFGVGGTKRFLLPDLRYVASATSL